MKEITQVPFTKENSVINRALILYLTIFPRIKQTQEAKKKKTTKEEPGSILNKNHWLILVICHLFNQAEVTQ